MSLFTDHPHSVGESYGQHCRFAAGVGFKLIGAGVAAVVHGLFPFWFERTASRAICDLYMRTHQRGAAANQGDDTGQVTAV